MLSKLEEHILLVMLRHGPDTTASEVQASLTEARGREQSFGSIFTTLDRLAEKRFVTWHKGEPEARRGGRAPRRYTVTALGQSTLRTSLQATRDMAHGANLGGVAPLATA